jgi:RimJ/RimL family protein N-acetyltransferase
MRSPALRDVPEAFETERLLIRCPKAGDGQTVYQSVLESLSALREFPASMPWASAEPSLEASEQFCREGQARYLLRKDMPMLLFMKGSGLHVGNSGLHSLEWSVPKCEIGYWGRARFARQGLITEAVRGITAFAFEHLAMRRIESLPDAENRASCLVCERAGYALEGTMRHDRLAPDGSLRNTCLYAVVR